MFPAFPPIPPSFPPFWGELSPDLAQLSPSLAGFRFKTQVAAQVTAPRITKIQTWKLMPKKVSDCRIRSGSGGSTEAGPQWSTWFCLVSPVLLIIFSLSLRHSKEPLSKPNDLGMSGMGVNTYIHTQTYTYTYRYIYIHTVYIPEREGKHF